MARKRERMIACGEFWACCPLEQIPFARALAPVTLTFCLISTFNCLFRGERWTACRALFFYFIPLSWRLDSPQV